MKKWFNITIAITLVFGIMLAVPSQNVQAKAEPKTVTDTWQYGPDVTGTEVELDLTTMPAPDWLQLMSTGLQISGASKICYPFRNAQFHWEGEIRQLVDGKWIKLDTTVARHDSEADYQACAQAPAAGTYALFAYYDGPAEGGLNCAAVGMYGSAFTTMMPSDGLWYVSQMSAYFSNLPAGIRATYSVVYQNPANSYSGDLTGSTISTKGNLLFAPIAIYYDHTLKPNMSILITFGGCHDYININTPPVN